MILCAEPIPDSVTRNLYDRLMEARGYVAEIANTGRFVPPAAGVLVAARRLEQIDAALAEAGDYIGRE